MTTTTATLSGLPAAPAAALSAATTPNGSASSSPSFATAPKKLIERELDQLAPRSKESRTIFPNKEAPFKVPIMPGREDTMPIKCHSTDKEEEDEIARNQLTISQRKTDKNGIPCFFGTARGRRWTRAGTPTGVRPSRRTALSRWRWCTAR
jgi:hypothetical protein